MPSDVSPPLSMRCMAAMKTPGVLVPPSAGSGQSVVVRLTGAGRVSPPLLLPPAVLRVSPRSVSFSVHPLLFRGYEPALVDIQGT